MKNVIYKISSLCKPERCYIGSSQEYFSSRKSKHLRELRQDKHHSSKLQNHFNKYGEEDLIFEVLELITCPCDLLSAEQRWMNSISPYFNIRKVAESNRGMKHSKETKAKISAWSKARRHSDETKKRISEVQKGKIIPEETRERMRLAKLGKKEVHIKPRQMKIGYYWKLLRGKTNALNPARLDLPHMWAVFQSWYRSLLPMPKHIKEQIIWRRTEVIKKSPTCWIAGACVQCGCFMIEKTTADMGCENEPYCYPAMMDKKTWKKFKKDNSIRLFELL